MKEVSPLPPTLPGRIRLVGEILHGREWHNAVAAGLGVHRATLWRWLGGKRPIRDVDGDLLTLLEAERTKSNERASRISTMQRSFLSMIRKADR